MTDGLPDENYRKLKNSARDAPELPGCYIMRDGEGRIIYVGKSKSLRNRLSAYFGGRKDVKTATLIRRTRAIETIIVSNEYEALLLENTLIKQHTPRYNINLKDGKSYPVIRLTAEAFPRLFRTRHIVEDGSRYFGPFANVQAVDGMLRLIEKLFPLRKCRSLRKKDNPCMYFHIGRCAAPCCGRIGEADYALHVERAAKLLAGETGSLVSDLGARMREEAVALNFENAARLRDAIADVENLAAANSVVDFDETGRDYIAWAAEGVLTCFSVFSMRGGKLTGRELYRACSAAAEEDSLETFISSYYSEDRPPPVKIFLMTAQDAKRLELGALLPVQTPGGAGQSAPVQNQAGWQEGRFSNIGRYFRERFGYAPEFRSPENGEDGEKRHLAAIAMARQNALEDLRKRLKERGAGPALDELRAALNLRRRPERIEGFDIAQLDGKHPVASLVSFKNGIPDKKNYRLFKLRSVIGIVDDFAAMREAVKRRYSRLIREGREAPDLILIDGGIGQVNAALGVLTELGLDCDLAGLAKRDEEIWLPGAHEPLKLSRRSEALKVLQAVRDETHRFATGLNQRLRSKEAAFPLLETIEGVGARRAGRIMKRYGSLAAIAAADVGEIAAACSLGVALARTVKAAACLALEDNEAEKRRLGGIAAAGGMKMAVAEPPPRYGDNN
ncbi:MAG: excinuclease ABC subunit UvrC [Spirochaetaceae bacterium]|jgi:excinuclease ABC subunit C|nr:excinuclease ABC subunit UvrC [Spirochaetaceae bacterium]